MHNKIELDFEQARTRHLLFKTKLRAILYGAETDEQPLRSHLDCLLGKWIYGHALKEYGHIPEMQQLEVVHTQIHESAHELIRLYKAGRVEESRKGLSGMELIADNLVALLTIIELKLKLSGQTASSDADTNEKLLQTNYKELLELHNAIRDLDARIRQQTDELYSTKKNVEKKLRNHFSQAPIAICILRGTDFIVELANDLYLQLVDKQHDFIGQPLFTALPELEGQGIREMLEGVIESGKPFIGNELEVILNRNGAKETTYFNFVYKSLEDHQDTTPGVMIVCSEVTAQVLAKKAMAENQLRLSIAIESAALGTFEVSLKTGDVSYSDRYLEIFGFTSDKKPTHAELITLIHPDDADVREQAFLTSAKTGALTYESRIILKDGSIRWMRASGKVFFDDKNRPEKVLGTAMDITESKLSEEKIRKANEVLEIAMQSAKLGSYELEIQTGNANFSIQCKENFGFDLDKDVTLEDLRSVTHPDDKEITRTRMIDALSSHRNYEAEYRIIDKNNLVRWISTSGKAVYGENDTILKLIGVTQNITERKKAEDELHISVEKFRLLADSMPQFVWTGDTSGNLDYFNQSVFDYTGLTPEQIYTEGWLQIVHPDDRALNIEKWMHSVQTGEDFLYEHRFKKHTGEYRWQLSRAIAQRNKAGEIQMWVGTSTDIQDQKMFAQNLEGLIKERTKELKNANIELENMNQELRSFTYVSSHDLQEPLRKIQTFISRIQNSDESNLSPEGKTYFGRIQYAANKMKTLINDLLTYSRTSASEKVFEKTNLSILLNEIKNEFAEALIERNGILNISAMPKEIHVIPFQVRQLFINLISNSIKFSKKDIPLHIEISFEKISGKDTGNINAHQQETYYHFSVKDNGIGFEPEYRIKIFEVFQRLHQKNEYEGTGIGLSICNKIVQNHHGFITAESEKDKGATFHIYLPLIK